MVCSIHGLFGWCFTHVDEVKKDTLILAHEHDGRDLELDYADNCVKSIAEIWGGPVKLQTQIEDEYFEV